MGVFFFLLYIEKVPGIKKERKGFWMRVLDSRVKCRKAKHARTSLIRTITWWPCGVHGFFC